MKPPGANAYLQTKVMTANPAELRLMLFDGAIRFARQAREGLTAKNYDDAFAGVTKCQAVLLELINGLRPEHDASLCQKLSSLYTFMYTRMMNACSQRDPAIVDEVIKLLTFERETWSMLLDQLAQENKAAARTMDAAPDVKPIVPASNSGIDSIIGATLSLRG